MSHTPGPRSVQVFDESQVCVLGPMSDGGRRELVGVFTGDHGMDNAVLDAAATDLLDACKRAVSFMRGDHKTNGIVGVDAMLGVLNAAISKAESEGRP